MAPPTTTTKATAATTAGTAAPAPATPLPRLARGRAAWVAAAAAGRRRGAPPRPAARAAATRPRQRRHARWRAASSRRGGGRASRHRVPAGGAAATLAEAGGTSGGGGWQSMMLAAAAKGGCRLPAASWVGGCAQGQTEGGEGMVGDRDKGRGGGGPGRRRQQEEATTAPRHLHLARAARVERGARPGAATPGVEPWLGHAQLPAGAAATTWCSGRGPRRGHLRLCPWGGGGGEVRRVACRELPPRAGDGVRRRDPVWGVGPGGWGGEAGWPRAELALAAVGYGIDMGCARDVRSGRCDQTTRI